ncbi:MAG: tetratricopeptide repeat protein [Xanthomonadales bacterium]|nr:tetratricopeptide repeat protein [Xanthomonadales bacterium]
MKKRTKSQSGFESKQQNDEAQAASVSLQKKKAGHALTFGKQLLFSLVIFVVFFGGIELILALSGVKPILLTEDPLVGFSSNVPLFVEQRRDDGTVVLRTAKNKLDHFNDQSFPKNKQKNTYRIFTVGGSTTAGRPFDHKVSFGGWLQAFLDEADPGTNWEVINAGGSSYASYRVAKLMQELVQYQPDLFIVYSGHNEFLEDRSYSGLTDLPSWVIELDSMLSGTRTYSGMKRLYDSWQPDSIREARKRYELNGEVDTILEYTFGPTSYHRDDELNRQIVAHYRLNLERMVLLARDAGAEIIFVTPANNLKDFSPFKSEHKKDLSGEAESRFNGLFETGNQLYAAGKPDEALTAYRQALSIDDRFADLHFQVGRALFELGKYDEAEKSFWRAIDEDVAPLRMLSSMQRSLVDVAESQAVPLVDFQQILRREYLKKFDHAVLGNEFFMDHVHTNIDGYRVLGLGLFNKLIGLGVVSPGAGLSASQIETVTRQITSSLEESDHYKSLFQLAKVLDWAGKFDAAKNLFLRHMELWGPRGDVYAQLGMVAAKRGRNAEAIDFFQKAISNGYETPDLYVWMANTYRNQGDFALAMKAYEDKLRLDGNKVEAHTWFGIQYALQGDNESALQNFRQALQLDPEFLPARRNLVVTLFSLGQYDEALVKGQVLLKDFPDEFRIHYVVGSILLQRGDRRGAIRRFSEALRLSPEFKPAQDGLRAAQRARSE